MFGDSNFVLNSKEESSLLDRTIRRENDCSYMKQWVRGRVQKQLFEDKLLSYEYEKLKTDEAAVAL